MKNFKLLLPTGGLVTEQTVFNSKEGKRKGKDLTEVELCKFMRSIWRKETDSKSFQDWADGLNESGDFEGTFTTEHALDNLANAFHLNIENKVVDVYQFYTTHLPLTK